jgi:hypothetical protein
MIGGIPLDIWNQFRQAWEDCELSPAEEKAQRPIIELGTPDQDPDPAWDGQGWPLAGMECVVTPHNTVWGFSKVEDVHCTVLGYFEDMVWLKQPMATQERPNACVFITTRTDKVDFRPVLTSEQIEAQERAKAVDAMYAIALRANDRTSNTASAHDMAICEALYSAGCRLPEAQS